ncbi:MAG: protein-L-isoaspartate(D-aspartate) O-methyltransferase [Myxococcota bacterium]|jgi:protein-L-isoaspartate(D-aspartate) O-methyltransferase|nr:protein-L-isoaspartate(D-aspartate) O-methyltransferase [Myxococcota bacterium]
MPKPDVEKPACRRAERQAMVRHQIEACGVGDPRVLAALLAVPRHRFVPERLQDFAYSDCPLPLGYGQTISQPYIVGYMSEQLDVERGARVLEVGSGCGYQTAVLLELGATVCAVELIPELALQAEAILRELGYAPCIESADGTQGLPARAPFDRILVAAAARAVPPAFSEQLVPGGKLVIPVGDDFEQHLLTLKLDEKRQWERLSSIPVRFVPLVDKARHTLSEPSSSL